MKLETQYGVVEILEPSKVQFENAYFETVYAYLYQHIDANDIYPQISFDSFRSMVVGFNIQELAQENLIQQGTNKDLWQRAMLPFMERYSVFYNFMQDLYVSAATTIKSAEHIIGEQTNNDNFIEIKKIIDQWNAKRWTRERNQSERQSGVSVLGGISEGLLQTALESYIDGINFFKNNKSEVQSYGDFVLMCLPNNLWLSVKSNFARERLLASGFTTDIIGVGFFTDDKEFTSGAKIRNFQKAGFLAMYVPDIPITDEQLENDESTYSAILKYYNEAEDKQLPLNINAKPFIRPLSKLNEDLSVLLSVEDIRKRVTIGF